MVRRQDVQSYSLVDGLGGSSSSSRRRRGGCGCSRGRRRRGDRDDSFSIHILTTSILCCSCGWYLRRQSGTRLADELLEHYAILILVIVIRDAVLSHDDVRVFSSAIEGRIIQ